MPTRTQATAQRRTIMFERTFDASLEDVWDLWTTREGVESWWGPEGFEVAVRTMDLRPGGALEYAMTATGSEQIAYLKGAGMPLTQIVRGTYKEVSPRTRLVYTNLADFIPGVEPYEVTLVVELRRVGKRVRMILTQDSMHDEQWTRLATMGWKEELGKLAKVLRQRAGRGRR